MDIEKVKKIIKESFTYKDVCNSLIGNDRSYARSKIKAIIKDNNISIEHFDSNHNNRGVYQKVKKNCPVCDTEFETEVRIIKGTDRRNRTTCSLACRNKHFRSGKNHPNFKIDSKQAYVRICFEHHERKCVVCDEENAVSVHHFNEDHNDNSVENLIPMCPNHHLYWHNNNLKHLVEQEVIEYRNNFLTSWLSG
jgi:hypothetical protein